MTAAGENEARLLRVARQDSDVEVFSVHNAVLRLAEHRFTRELYLLDSTVIELKELAIQDHLDILLAVLGVDFLKLSQVVGARDRIFNERVRSAEERFKDLVVHALVDVALEAIRPLHHAILQAVFTILVVDAFHKWVTQDLPGLAYLHELLIRMSFLLAIASHRVRL